MSAPSYESVSSRNIDETATSTPSVDKPSGTSSGDLLLMFLCYNSGTSSTTEPDSITFPTGFQVIRSDINSPNRRNFIAYKIAGGSEPSSYTVTLPQSTLKTQLSILRFSNVDSVAPISDIILDSYTGGSSDTANRHKGPAITATANQLAVRLAVINDNVDSTISADSGVTLIVNEDTTTGDDTTVVIGVDSSTYTSGDSVPKQGFTSTAADSSVCSTLLLNGPSTVVAAIPVLESQTTHNGLTGGGVSAGGPFSIAKPAGVEEGDLLIGMFISPETISIDGFTNLSQATSSPDTYTHLIAYKYATSSEPSTYTATISSNFYIAGFIVRVSNVDSSTPFADSDIGSEIVYNWSYPATTPASKSLIIRGVFDDNDSMQENRFNISCGGQMFFAQDKVGLDKSARIFTEPYSVVTGNQPLRNDAGGSNKIPFTLAINPDPSAGGGGSSSTHIQRTLTGAG